MKIDVAEMANELFDRDTRWLAEMCEEELRQRELLDGLNKRSVKEYLESLSEEQRQKVLSCGRNRNKIL